MQRLAEICCWVLVKVSLVWKRTTSLHYSCKLRSTSAEWFIVSSRWVDTGFVVIQRGNFTVTAGLNSSSGFLWREISVFSPCVCEFSPPHKREHYVVCSTGPSSSCPRLSEFQQHTVFPSSNHQPSFQTPSFKWRWVIPVGVFSQALDNVCKELQFLCNKSFEQGWELFTS